MLYRMGRSAVTDLLETAFRTQAFPGGHGPLCGADLTVVKTSTQTLEGSYSYSRMDSLSSDAELFTAMRSGTASGRGRAGAWPFRW